MAENVGPIDFSSLAFHATAIQRMYHVEPTLMPTETSILIPSAPLMATLRSSILAVDGWMDGWMDAANDEVEKEVNSNDECVV